MNTRYQQNYKALGSETFITLVMPDNTAKADNIFTDIHNYIDKFEYRFSRFLPNSELSLFNQQAGNKVEISKEFNDLLVAASFFSEKTNGLYNPFILPSLQRAGYIGSWPEVNKAQNKLKYQAREIVKISDLKIDKAGAKIPKNSALDFGGIGKGYLLDKLSEKIRGQGIEDFWLSLGGDIICSGNDINSSGWEIAVQSAVDTKNTVDNISTNGQLLAIATSGITKRGGTYKGKRWHHIIDPLTGYPAETNILTATVTANSATAADVYAKCIIIGGEEIALKLERDGHINMYILQTQTSDQPDLGAEN